MRHKPLSLVSFYKSANGGDKSEMGFVTKNNKVYPLKDIRFIKTENFADLFQLQNFSSLSDFVTYDLIEESIEDYVIGIPYVVKTDDDRKLYYFVTSKGKELQENFNFNHTSY